MEVSGFRISTEHTIREGRLDEFKETILELMAQFEKIEPRTKEYIVFITEDGRYCQFNQWYEDIDAFVEHLKGSGKVLAERLDGLSDFVRSWIYTDLDSQEARDLIDSFGTTDRVVVGPAFAGYRRDFTNA